MSPARAAGPQVPGSYSCTGAFSPHRIDDAPRLFDVVLAREQRGVALHRVAQHALVGVHLVGAGLPAREQLDPLADHLVCRRPSP